MFSVKYINTLYVISHAFTPVLNKVTELFWVINTISKLTEQRQATYGKVTHIGDSSIMESKE